MAWNPDPDPQTQPQPQPTASSRPEPQIELRTEAGSDLATEGGALAGTPEPPGAELAVAVREASRTFVSRSGPVLALDTVSLELPPARLAVVAGPSGSGKSTLLRLIACLDRPDSGEVYVGGVDVLALNAKGRRELRRTSIGVVLPQPAHNLLPGIDAGDNLVWAARQRTRAQLSPAGVDAHLEMVGLGGAARKRVHHLSGGEQQRLALAIAMVGDPQLVVADEPTASLDADSAVRLANALRDVADQGATILVASHDDHIIGLADEITHLAHGRVV